MSVSDVIFETFRVYTENLKSSPKSNENGDLFCMCYAGGDITIYNSEVTTFKQGKRIILKFKNHSR